MLGSRFVAIGGGVAVFFLLVTMGLLHKHHDYVSRVIVARSYSCWWHCLACMTCFCCAGAKDYLDKERAEAETDTALAIGDEIFEIEKEGADRLEKIADDLHALFGRDLREGRLRRSMKSVKRNTGKAKFLKVWEKNFEEVTILGEIFRQNLRFKSGATFGVDGSAMPKSRSDDTTEAELIIARYLSTAFDQIDMLLKTVEEKSPHTAQKLQQSVLDILDPSPQFVHEAVGDDGTCT